MPQYVRLKNVAVKKKLPGEFKPELNHGARCGIRSLRQNLMTLDKATELLKVQADFGGFYNANSAKLILAEVSREHGQAAVDRLIRELDLDKVFNFEPGMRFEGGLAMKDNELPDMHLICINDNIHAGRLSCRLLISIAPDGAASFILREE